MNKYITFVHSWAGIEMVDFKAEVFEAEDSEEADEKAHIDYGPHGYTQPILLEELLLALESSDNKNIKQRLYR